MVKEVEERIQKSHPEYTLALDKLSQYYDLKLVTYGVDPRNHSLVVTFPVPTTIEFKSHEKEELDPVTGKIIRTHVIYPIIIPKEKESVCISVPPLSETKGQLNSLAPSPLAAKFVTIDGNTSTTTTPQGPPTPLPTPCADWVMPVPAVEPARDVADSDGVLPPSPWTPTPPRWTPLTYTTHFVPRMRLSFVTRGIVPFADITS